MQTVGCARPLLGTLGGKHRRMSVYGHRILSMFFRPLIEVSNEGFRYKGREYAWREVRSIHVSDSPWNALAGYPAAIPRATIFLADGAKIRLNGRALEKMGQKPLVGFSSSKSDAFDELIGIFKSHAA